MEGICGTPSCGAKQRLSHGTKPTADDDEFRVEYRDQIGQAASEFGPDLGDQTARYLVSGIRGPGDILTGDRSRSEGCGEGPFRIEAHDFAGQSDESRTGRDGLPASSFPTVAQQAGRIVPDVSPLPRERLATVDGPIDHDRSADSGSEGYQQEIVESPGGTGLTLTECGNVRIIVHGDRHSEIFFEKRLQRNVDSFDVGPPRQDTLRPFDETGETDADRFHVIVPDSARRVESDVDQWTTLRRGMPFIGEDAFVEADGEGFCSSDVDSDGAHGRAGYQDLRSREPNTGREASDQ
jgi:hypothetical protein